MISNAILEYGLPCAKESGLSGDDLSNIQSGNFGAVGPQVGCFSDCVSKKLGLVDDSNAFNTEAFKGKLADFVLPDRIQEFMDNCNSQIGEEKCNASAEFYHCILNIVLAKVLS